MKNTKKVLSVALAGALAFGSMGAAFAAAPVMDAKTDKNIAQAVERLHALGIVNGMEDGKYHEEMKVTREQFAKLLVEALGLGNAADAAKGSTKFNDIEASRWSAGYVNVAVGQGLIKGYPDGTFKPAAEVNYAEAVTMLVRALGYKDEFVKGAWPGNYVAKAADVKITEGAKFGDANGKADRGSVAVLVDNTLDAKVVKVSEYVDGQTKYSESNMTLLEDKLDIKEYSDVRLVKNERLDDGLDSNEVQFSATKKDVDFVKGDLANAGDVATVDIVKGLNTDSLMGLKVKVYVNDKDEVVFMQRDGSETVVTDAISKVTNDGANLKELELYKLDDEYAFNSTATAAYLTGKDETKVKSYDQTKLTAAALGNDLEAGMFGKFVIENNKIVFADIMDADEANGMIVTKVDAENKEITGIVSTNDNQVIDLGDDYDNYIIMDGNGKTLEMKDIKANNVLYVAKTEIDGKDYAIVTVVANNELKGKFTKAKDSEVEIAGKSYDLVKNNTNKAVDGVTNSVVSTFSSNNNKDIYSYSVSDSKLEDMDDQEITAITDITGRVLHMASDVKGSSNDLYGIITKVYAENEQVKVYVGSLNKELTYKFEEEADLTNLAKGDFIKFSLNKAGEIADGEIEKAVKLASNMYTVNAEFGKDTIKTTAGNTFIVNSDTLFMDAPNLTYVDADGAGAGTAYIADASTLDTEDLAVVKWADLKEDDSNAQFVGFIDDKGALEAVTFIGAGIGASTDDEQAAYVIDTWKKGSDTIAKVEFYDGTVKEIVLDNSKDVLAAAGTQKTSSVVKAETAIVAKVQGDGELEYVETPADFTIKTAQIIEDKDGDYIKFQGDASHYKLDAAKTLVYEEDTKKKVSNITKTKTVTVIVEDGINVRAVKIHK